MVRLVERGEGEKKAEREGPLWSIFLSRRSNSRRVDRFFVKLLSLSLSHPFCSSQPLQAADINALFGFRLECIERLGDPHGVWAWTRLNALFNYLPLAALIEDRILCMHGGIGRSISRIEQIAELQRPLKMEDGGLVLMDLLWSDPTTNDAVEGVQPSPRGPGLVTFGPDRVIEFCKENELQMIVRAHECVMDGFERFAQGHLITLFSATNYCGTANNAGKEEEELIFFSERGSSWASTTTPKIRACSFSPLALRSKLCHTPKSVQHSLKSAFKVVLKQKRDSNFLVSKSNSCVAVGRCRQRPEGFESPNLSVLEVEKNAKRLYFASLLCSIDSPSIAQHACTSKDH